MSQNNGSASLQSNPVLHTDHSTVVNSGIMIKYYPDHGENSDYNFENFVEGKCNMMARSAGIIVCTDPGHFAFNPLIIFGDTGVGKTHLAHAIGNLSKEKFPGGNILFLNTKKFLNQYSQAFRNKKVEDFLNFYEATDILILDDIHEIAFNKSLQASLLKIFNRPLLKAGQLILTCSKITKELEDFEKNFLSRFKGGFRVFLQKPDYNTKLAILKRKMFDYQLELPDEMLEIMAMKVPKDIRELESFLILINPNSINYNMDTILDGIKHMIGKESGPARPLFTIDYIQKYVCQYYKVPLDKMLGRARKKEIVQARQVSMFFSKSLAKATLESIGLRTGGRDHATVLYACKTIKRVIKENAQFRGQIKEIERNLIFSTFKRLMTDISYQ